jgi:cytochrome bd-type quinol oxidase subunit 2
LPGVQTFLGFQLMSVFNQRFELFDRHEQLLHYAAFLMVAVTMGLMMAPAAYLRQAERDRISRRFVDMSSWMLSLAMLPFIAGVCLDTYLLGRLIIGGARLPALLATLGLCVVLTELWFVWPGLHRRRRRSHPRSAAVR